MRNIFLALAVLSGSSVCAAAGFPTERIDAGTAHRVIRLSREDGAETALGMSG